MSLLSQISDVFKRLAATSKVINLTAPMTFLSFCREVSPSYPHWKHFRADGLARDVYRDSPRCSTLLTPPERDPIYFARIILLISMVRASSSRLSSARSFSIARLIKVSSFHLARICNLISRSLSWSSQRLASFRSAIWYKTGLLSSLIVA